ncbi:MAG TPA: sigma 54-interacting transcriptional regulator [Vicinamibacterales bacterium]|nr:sigma 54-interacting transcriptional regulator [Vicinamibacterales bacterium]
MRPIRGGAAHGLSSPIFASEQMREVFRLAKRAAASDTKVLITGESGVGKDVVARFIHAHSARNDAKYIAVNSAGVAESLLESELFGHVKGSFTGAHRSSPGKLLLADKGTLFLDEVGEMSPRMQALLLRFLENGEIQAVGDAGSRTRVDVRVIAATNRDLRERVRASHFREDLLYRLQVIHLRIPPLRDRRADIRPLALHFLEAAGRNLTLTDDAWQALERYRWPGNVRELHNVVDQVVWLADTDGLVDVDKLPEVVTASHNFLPAKERRRRVADDLYQALVNGYSFWDHIHPLLLNREITRHDLRELVRRGLSVTRGNYRGLLRLFGMRPRDYKRFMNVLATHDCRPDFREFRSVTAEHATSPRAVPNLLPPLPEPQLPEEEDLETPAVKTAS